MDCFLMDAIKRCDILEKLSIYDLLEHSDRKFYDKLERTNTILYILSYRL